MGQRRRKPINGCWATGQPSLLNPVGEAKESSSSSSSRRRRRSPSMGIGPLKSACSRRSSSSSRRRRRRRRSKDPMAQVLNLALPRPHPLPSSSPSPSRTRPRDLRRWASLQQSLKCNGRFSCLFSDNRREDQARKALESALGGKKSEFEKWNKEIKRREEVGGGGDAGGGGWFGWGGKFGWSNGDNFWQEAKQISLAVLGIILMFLLIAKGEVMLAMVLNPLLFALRGARDVLTFVTTKILRLSPSSPAGFDALPKNENRRRVSAKEEVLRKWGSA